MPSLTPTKFSSDDSTAADLRDSPDEARRKVAQARRSQGSVGKESANHKGAKRKHVSLDFNAISMENCD